MADLEFDETDLDALRDIPPRPALFGIAGGLLCLVGGALVAGLVSAASAGGRNQLLYAAGLLGTMIGGVATAAGLRWRARFIDEQLAEAAARVEEFSILLSLEWPTFEPESRPPRWVLQKADETSERLLPIERALLQAGATKEAEYVARRRESLHWLPWRRWLSR
jgi:hypothetical protein